MWSAAFSPVMIEGALRLPFVTRGKIEASKPDILGDKPSADEQKVYVSDDHMGNFFDCVKSHEQPVANAEVMHHSMASVHAANLCMWLRQDLEYDPEKESFPNNANANLFLERSYRRPWTV